MSKKFWAKSSFEQHHLGNIIWATSFEQHHLSNIIWATSFVQNHLSKIIWAKSFEQNHLSNEFITENKLLLMNSCLFTFFDVFQWQMCFSKNATRMSQSSFYLMSCDLSRHLTSPIASFNFQIHSLNYGLKMNRC